MQEEIYLTQQGLDEIKKELEHLITVKRPEIVQEIKEARALGDLSENAEYDAAKNEQSELEKRILDLTQKIEKAVVIKQDKTDKVSIGSTVEIEYIDDKEKEEYTIVGSTEADPFENKISNESPIAQAILDKKAGEKAKVISPNGEYEVKIIKIK